MRYPPILANQIALSSNISDGYATMRTFTHINLSSSRALWKTDHPMDYINTAYERMLKSDVRYRFVIDMASLD